MAKEGIPVLSWNTTERDRLTADSVLRMAVDIVKEANAPQPEFMLQRVVKSLVGIIESDLLRDKEACEKLKGNGFMFVD